MGAAEVTRFLTSLAVDGHVAASAQTPALSARLFRYREVLEQDLPWLDNVVRAKGAQRLPWCSPGPTCAPSSRSSRARHG